MARIPYYDWSQAPEKLKAYYDSLAPLNVYVIDPGPGEGSQDG